MNTQYSDQALWINQMKELVEELTILDFELFRLETELGAKPRWEIEFFVGEVVWFLSWKESAAQFFVGEKHGKRRWYRLGDECVNDSLVIEAAKDIVKYIPKFLSSEFTNQQGRKDGFVDLPTGGTITEVFIVDRDPKTVGHTGRIKEITKEEFEAAVNRKKGE